MPLAAGTRLGPYEILAAIGEGGMGEVYKARDTRLDRIVAIKVAQEQFSERFEREARAVAALNHPHICTLYDVGPNYLVMEYLEGAPLAGPMPLGQALTYAAQICDALDAAHRKGIVHRDLKPSNTLIVRSGAASGPSIVKLLDFGLAKHAATTASGPHDDAATVAALTGAHTILGTPQYMAPEQIEGREADARADIFAFGCVLYEVLTGRKAFDGRSAASVMAAILATEPRSMRELQPMTPPALERIVTRCLAKDPEHRWQSARDLKAEIEWIASGGAAVSTAATRAPRRPWAWIAATTLFALLVPAAWFLKPATSPPPPQPMLEMTITPPEGVTFLPGTSARALVNFGALSPDGRYLVVRGAGRDGKPMLWLHTLATDTAAPLAGTEGASRPFWKPDSQWIAFSANGRLLRIGIAGGQPRPICNGDASTGGGTWNADGVILFAQGGGKPLQRVADSGGVPSPVLPLDEAQGELLQSEPQFLPDGQHFLYSSRGNSNVMLASLDGKPRRRLFSNRNSPAFFAAEPGGGRLLFVDAEGQTTPQLLAWRFDPDRGELIGDREFIAELRSTGPSFAMSANGLLAFERSRPALRQLTWFSRNGTPRGAVGPVADLGRPRISPDGTMVAFDQRGRQNHDVWLLTLANGVAHAVTNRSENEGGSAWTFDGTLLYNEVGKGLVEHRFDGQPDHVLMTSQEALNAGYLSAKSPLVPVGRGFTFSLIARPGGRPFGTPMDRAVAASISPDGRWLVYQGALRTNQPEIFVRAIPRDAAAGWGTETQVSTAGGTRAHWGVDGKEVFYVDAEGRMTAVAVDTSGPVATVRDNAEVLFSTRLLESPRYFDYDVAKDGRFLIAQPVAVPDDPRITVIVNWTQLLKR